MEELLILGITEDSIKYMLEINKEIISLTPKEIKDKIEILQMINCNDDIIKNIIESNPLYLSRSNKDIENLIIKLNNLGISRLDTTFDSNPWLLNKNDFEIEDFIEEKKKESFNLEEIIDRIDSGMIN